MKEKREVSKLSATEEERAKQLLEKTILVNGLESTYPDQMHDEYFGKLLQAGFSAVNDTVYALPSRAGETRDPLREFMNETATHYGMIERSKKAILATSVQRIRYAKDEGKLAVIFGTQNADFIEDVSWVSILRRLGIRICQLTYQRRNKIGDGCGERKPAGLSRFGVQVVEEMNRVGIVMDFSHVSPATTLDAIEVSKDPVIFSHTAVRSLSDVVRNKTDEEIKAMSEKGGVMGIAPKSNWMKPRGARSGTTIEDYMDHIDYLANLVGVDHVGVGLDIGNGRSPYGKYVTPDSEKGKPAAMFTPRLFPEVSIWTEGDDITKTNVQELAPPVPRVLNVARGAIARGYSDQEIVKILGENFLRVFDAVWKK